MIPTRPDLIATDIPFKRGKDFHATPESVSTDASFQADSNDCKIGGIRVDYDFREYLNESKTGFDNGPIVEV